MKTIQNKANRPLAVPLPRGKKLHLGPQQTGQIADGAEEHPPLKSLIDAGEIELLGEGERPTGAVKSDVATHSATRAHQTGNKSGRRGDR